MQTIWIDFKRLWRIKPFRRLILARVISNFGNGLGPVAVAFGVLGLPGATASDLSKVQAALFLPLVVFMLIGGIVADRFPRALVVGASDIVLGALVVFSGVLFLTDQQSVGKLIIISFISGTLAALWWPAFTGITPEIVAEEDLQSANSVVSFASNATNIFGIVAGGMIVAAIGPGWAILGDGITFLVAGILVLQLRKFGKRRETNEHAPTVLDDLVHGWREFSSRHWVVAVVLGYTIIAMGLEAVFAVLGPYNAKLNLDGARPWSWIMAAMSVGMALGVVISMRIRPKHPLILGMSAQVGMVLFIVTMSVTNNVGLIMAAAFCCGVGMDLFMVLWQTALQTNIPRDSLSRVSSYDAFGSLAMAPLGLIVAGPAAQHFGVGTTMRTIGIMIGVTVLIVLAMPSVRRLEAVQTESEA